MKKVKGPDDEFWARVYAEGQREIEGKWAGDFWAPSLLSELGLDELERKAIAEVMADIEDGDCPGCEKCEDWVRGQRGGGATLKG